LNAAVEAARSGKHGKGFAIVAQEVRHLATRCASAALEASELLENSVEKVSEGTRVAEKNSDVLREIEMGITTLNGIVADIATACMEQAQSIGHVNSGLEKINAVTMSNTSNSEETSVAAETLAVQASHVRRIVERFTLRDDQEEKQHVFDEQDIQPWIRIRD